MQVASINCLFQELDLEGKENKRLTRRCQAIEVRSFKHFSGVNFCFSVILRAEIHTGTDCHLKRKINTICFAHYYLLSLELTRKFHWT